MWCRFCVLSVAAIQSEVHEREAHFQGQHGFAAQFVLVFGAGRCGGGVFGALLGNEFRRLYWPVYPFRLRF